MMSLRWSIAIVAALLSVGAAAQDTTFQSRAPQQAASPSQPQAAGPTPIRKDPAETTGAITPRKFGQESERVIDGQRCSDVLDQPTAFSHELWVRCRTP